MKKVLIAVMAGICVLFSGCKKELPTADTMNKVATSVGIAAGTVANMTKIDDASRNVVCDIMNKVREFVPAKDQSFTDCWVPVADAYIKELKDAGKINDLQESLIKSGVKIACKGIDYIFDKKYPKAKEVEELTRAAASGVIDGFLTVFKPVDANAAEKAKANMDKDAYEYLVKEIK